MSFVDGRDALAARLVLADAAQRSLDMQYFIWNKDLAGKVLLDGLFRAADRGVRVRLLLDDLSTMPSDIPLLAIDSHPNVEVRMFNPVAMRSLRVLGMVADLGRINKRMQAPFSSLRSSRCCSLLRIALTLDPQTKWKSMSQLPSS